MAIEPKHKIVNGLILESVNGGPYKVLKNPDGSNMKATAAQQKEFDETVAKQKSEKASSSSNQGAQSRISQAASKLDDTEYSVAEDTGEKLPFNKDVAGKGDGSLGVDITPWYGDEMKTNYTKEEWDNFVKSTGFKPTVKNTSRDPKAQVKEFQYYLAHHPDWKNSIDQLHSTGTGKDQFGTPTKSGKKYDGYLGRRWDLLIEKKPELPTPDKTIAKKEEDEPAKGDRPAIKTNTPTNYQLPENDPWWLQDIIKTAGSAADLARIKRYMPWQATPQVRLPEATFYDPTRELAANTEMANLALQNSQAFTSPQQQAAANSVAQGQAAKNAADIMGRYNNLNVGLANQLSNEQAGIMNQASLNKANLDTQLWDKYTILNQQFDNSKAQARQNLRQSYIDAITNRANTANLNSLYPEYAVNPMDGGKVYFRPDPNKIKATDRYDKYDELWKKAGRYASDRASQERLFNYMLKNGSDESSDSELNNAALRGYPGASAE
jgi:hypothetical protein